MRLPPINALRAFEAAARHRSFKRAGEELNVTPGAVSRFVRIVEQDMGVSLFERLPNGLRLTAKGEALGPRLTQAFHAVEDAIRQTAAAPDEIRMMLPETIGSRLLIGKIAEYNQAGLGAHVRYSLEFKTWDDFFARGYDLGVCCFFSAKPRPAELEYRLLRREALTPVCAPALLEGGPRLREPEDLARHELLHSYPDKNDWKKWIAAAGLHTVDGDSGTTFLSMELAVRAAMQGAGIAIADLTLFRDEVAAGELVVPFDLIVSESTGYFLFGRPDRLAEPQVRKLCDWLTRELGNAATPAEG